MPAARREPPPAGAPWDSPLDEAPLAFVDLEMTGLDVERDHVVEVCIERVVGGEVVRKLSSLVRPPARAGGSAEIHGLDAAALETAPPFEAVAAEVRELLSGAVFVAHGAKLDVAFLLAESLRVGAPLEIAHWLDTMNLSRRAFALPSHALSSLAASLGIAMERAHRADDDVAAMRQVFLRCCGALAPATPRDLWEVRVASPEARVEILDACDAACRDARDVVVVYRPRGQAEQRLRMRITKVERGEGARVQGYEVTDRGRRSLRASRILRVEPVA